MAIKPLINIITRTSNRPNYFRKCVDSIKRQTYKNIRHWVVSDNIEDRHDYLNDYNDIKIVPIEKDWLKQELDNDIPNPNTGARSPYNLYFNKVISQISVGWILILDDDDTLKEPDSIAKMVSHIVSRTDLVLFQMEYLTGYRLPPERLFHKTPILGTIGSPCVLVHSSIAKKVKWDGWKCGDYRYISKIYKLTKNKKWIKQPLIGIGSNNGNLGKRNDIEETKVIIKNKIKEVKKKSSSSKPMTIEQFKEINKNRAINKKQIDENYSGEKTKILVLAVGWNCQKYIGDFYHSIKRQLGKNFEYKIYIVDDFSKDNTYRNLKNLNDDRIVIIRNKKNMGAAYSRWICLKEMIANEDEESIVFQIDLDDWIKNNTFHDISNIYLENDNIQMTVGNFEYNSGVNRLNKLFLYDKKTIDNRDYHKIEKFLAPSLRTFKLKLAKIFVEDDFKDKNGKFLKYCTDVALIFGLLIQLDSSQLKSIKNPYYIYRRRADGTLKRFTHNKKVAMLNYLKNKFRKKYENNLVNGSVTRKVANI